MILKGIKRFLTHTGISEATLHVLFDKAIKQQQLWIDQEHYGGTLKEALSDVNIHGFWVVVFIDHPEITMDHITLLDDVVIMGDGDCPECGGVLEHCETLRRTSYDETVMVECNVSDYNETLTYNI